MKHLIMDAAGWWLTWAAFVGAAWGGLILTAIAIVSRVNRALAPTPGLAAEVEHAADRAPWPTPAAYIDAPKVPVSDDIEWQRIVRAFKEDGL